MAEYPGDTRLELNVGDRISFNFGGAPSGGGIFLGWTDFGWIALDVHGTVGFYNPAQLNTITKREEA